MPCPSDHQPVGLGYYWPPVSCIAFIHFPLHCWEYEERSADSDIKIKLISIGSFCIKMIQSELVFGAIFYKKLHDFLFINFGGKFCNIRLNFSTQKIFTKVGHDISLKGEELHQLYVYLRDIFPVGMRS